MKQLERAPVQEEADAGVDFSRGRRGEFPEWYQKAKGNFVHVSDAEDRARQANKRAPKT